MNDIVTKEISMQEQNVSQEETKSTTTTSATNEVLTKVVSVASEDLKNGTTTKLPTAEEMVAKAAISMTEKRMMLERVMGGLSKKATLRVINAIFELPTEGLPIFLKSENEKLAFALGQRIQSDRFILVQHHIAEEMRRIKKEREEKQENTNDIL